MTSVTLPNGKQGFITHVFNGVATVQTDTGKELWIESSLYPKKVEVNSSQLTEDSIFECDTVITKPKKPLGFKAMLYRLWYHLLSFIP